MANQGKTDPYPFSFIALTFLAFIVVATTATHFMNRNAAWGTGACLVGLVFAAKSRWDLNKEWWFWTALCLGAILQVPSVVFIPWAAPHLNGVAATAFVIPGFITALGCVFLAERVFAKAPRPK